MADPRPQIHQLRLPSRSGCVFPVLFALFLLMPIAELALLFWSARHVGFWWTLLACVGTALAGSAIARWQGAVVFRRAQESIARGEVPADAVLDGVMLLVGGVLLLAPGFLSDAAGFLLLLPPSRAFLKSLARRRFQRKSGIIDVTPE